MSVLQSVAIALAAMSVITCSAIGIGVLLIEAHDRHKVPTLTTVSRPLAHDMEAGWTELDLEWIRDMGMSL